MSLHRPVPPPRWLRCGPPRESRSPVHRRRRWGAGPVRSGGRWRARDVRPALRRRPHDPVVMPGRCPRRFRTDAAHLAASARPSRDDRPGRRAAGRRRRVAARIPSHAPVLPIACQRPAPACHRPVRACRRSAPACVRTVRPCRRAAFRLPCRPTGLPRDLAGVPVRARRTGGADVAACPTRYPGTCRPDANGPRRSGARSVRNFGGVLLSRGAYPQVPSALAGLTSVFGMETGVTPPPWPPKTCCPERGSAASRGLHSEHEHLCCWSKPSAD